MSLGGPIVGNRSMAKLFDLSGFQRDVLYVIYHEDQQHGKRIKEELEKEMGEISRGRLYPNLDTLVKAGYVEKGSIDLRTNYYEITELGIEQLKSRREWENRYIDFDDL